MDAAVWMVSTIFRPSVGSGGSERVRWIERNYAIQNSQNATRNQGSDLHNGSLMECGLGGRAPDGRKAVESREPEGGRGECARWWRADIGALWAAEERVLRERRVAGCVGVVWRWD